MSVLSGASRELTAEAPSSMAAAAAVYRRRTLARLAVLGGLALATAVAFIVSMMVGPIPLTFGDVVRALVDPAADARAATVVIDLRLPPALLAVLVGASLSLAGVQMQTILDNPLAEPFTLGISAAAALGAAIAIVWGVTLPFAPGATLPVAAMVGGLAASLLVAGVARVRTVTRETTVLLGVALVFSCQALLALLQYRASTESLQQIVFWTMGSTMRATWVAVASVAFALLVATPLFWVHGWRLTAMALGESRAASMGIDVVSLRSWTLVGVALLASLSVAHVGIIGFVGLVGPHIARLLVGEDQRFLMPAALLSGAALLSAAHAASQVVVPGVAVPVGILTALVGVPCFLLLVFGRRGRAGVGG